MSFNVLTKSLMSYLLNIITHHGESSSCGQVTFDTLEKVAEFIRTDNFALTADELELFDADRNDLPLPG